MQRYINNPQTAQDDYWNDLTNEQQDEEYIKQFAIEENQYLNRLWRKHETNN